MFGAGRALEKLRADMAELRGEVSRLQTELEQARTLLRDAQNIERTRVTLEGIRLAAEGACDVLQARAQTEQIPGRRRRIPLNKVERAEVTGYVALYFDGGRTDSVRILVGQDEVPDQCVAEANSSNDINSYAGAIVRAGEFWRVESKVGASATGFVCIFTPLY